MQKWFLLAKKVHRTNMFFLIPLILVMSFTGMMMKFSDIFFSLQIDTLWARSLHNTLSLFLSLSLYVMMLSGVFMFCLPYINRWKSKSSTSNDPAS